MADEKRIKDFEPAAEILNDDWFAVDSPSQGTRKIQTSMFQAGLQSQITANRDDIDLQAGQIATLQLGVSNMGDDVDALKTKVGDADLQTTADDLSGAINEHEGDINAINSKLTTVFTIRTVSTTVSSIAGGGSGMDRLAVPAVSGYTPLGIVGMETGSTGSAMFVIYSYGYLSNEGNIRFKYKNYGTGTASPTVDFYVLYVKSSLV